jgi:prevent-host-death family protein
MREVTVQEANERLDELLDAAARGDEVMITRGGEPIAQLVPVPAPAATAAEQELRRAEALAFFRRGLKGGVVVDWTRDELYERDRWRPEP